VAGQVSPAGTAPPFRCLTCVAEAPGLIQRRPPAGRSDLSARVARRPRFIRPLQRSSLSRTGGKGLPTPFGLCHRIGDTQRGDATGESGQLQEPAGPGPCSVPGDDRHDGPPAARRPGACTPDSRGLAAGGKAHGRAHPGQGFFGRWRHDGETAGAPRQLRQASSSQAPAGAVDGFGFKIGAHKDASSGGPGSGRGGRSELTGWQKGWLAIHYQPKRLPPCVGLAQRAAWAAGPAQPPTSRRRSGWAVR